MLSRLWSMNTEHLQNQSDLDPDIITLKLFLTDEIGCSTRRSTDVATGMSVFAVISNFY